MGLYNFCYENPNVGERLCSNQRSCGYETLFNDCTIVIDGFTCASTMPNCTTAVGARGTLIVSVILSTLVTAVFFTAATRHLTPYIHRLFSFCSFVSFVTGLTAFGLTASYNLALDGALHWDFGWSFAVLVVAWILNILVFIAGFRTVPQYAPSTKAVAGPVSPAAPVSAGSPAVEVAQSWPNQDVEQI